MLERDSRSFNMLKKGAFPTLGAIAMAGALSFVPGYVQASAREGAERMHVCADDVRKIYGTQDEIVMGEIPQTCKADGEPIFPYEKVFIAKRDYAGNISSISKVEYTLISANRIDAMADSYADTAEKLTNESKPYLLGLGAFFGAVMGLGEGVGRSSTSRKSIQPLPQNG